MQPRKRRATYRSDFFADRQIAPEAGGEANERGAVEGDPERPSYWSFSSDLWGRFGAPQTGSVRMRLGRKKVAQKRT